MKLLVFFAATYVFLVALVVVFQRRMIYFPMPLYGPTPENFGISFEEVFFTNASSLRLHGWWIAPPAKGAPVVLYCHGNAANLSSLAEVAYLFHLLGAGVFLWDYRCYGRSEKGPLSQQGLLEDAEAALSALRARADEKSPLYFWGHSLGSAVAALLAERFEPDVLILEGTFPSLPELARRVYPWLFVPKKFFKDPWCVEESVSRRKCPLWVVHGEKDAIVPLVLGRKVFEKAAPPKKLLVLENMGHNDLPRVFDRVFPEIQKIFRWPQSPGTKEAAESSRK